jgi:AcrR family transcriptional regulator
MKKGSSSVEIGSMHPIEAHDDFRLNPERTVSKHAIRRRETRARFLRAARELISQGRLATFSVDDVCQIAGVSRTGFYLHFNGKSELLDSLQKEMGEWYVRQFRKLDCARAVTEEGVIEWIEGFIRGFRGTKQTVLLFPSREDGVPGIRARVRGEAVLALGSQIPAFGLIKSDGSVDEERRIELLLLVFQIEQVALHLALDAPSNSDLYIRVLARHFLRLIESAEK